MYIIKKVLLLIGILLISNIHLNAIELSEMNVNKLEDNDFRPQAEVNWRTALFSAYASFASYEDKDNEFTFEDFAKKYNFSKIAEIDKELDISDDVNDDTIPVDLQAYVYKKKMKIDNEYGWNVLIVFRGTKGLKDINTNAHTKSTTFRKITVHRGFWASMDAFQKEISEYYKYNDIINKSNTKFTIVGHSLGGSIAELYAAKLVKDGLAEKNQISVYTIGQAAAGNKDFVAEYKNKFFHHRLYHSDDPILVTDNLKAMYLDNGYMIGSGGHSSLVYIKTLKNYMEKFNNSYSWNGNGSVLSYKITDTMEDDNKTNWGFEGDTSNINKFKLPLKSFNSFQWQVNEEYGKNLKISSKDIIGKVNVCYSRWNNEDSNQNSMGASKYCYNNVNLPFILSPEKDGYSISNGNWFIVGITTKDRELNNALYAKPTTTEYTGNISSSKKATYIDGTHIWTGTGSLVNYQLRNKTEYGLSHDVATMLHKTVFNYNAVVFFQWEVNRVAGTNVRIDSNCATKATITMGSWSSRKDDLVFKESKLPITIKAPDSKNGEWKVIKVKVNETKKECIPTDDNGLWIRAKVIQ